MSERGWNNRRLWPVRDHMPQVFSRYRIEVVTPRVIDDDRGIEAAAVIAENHVEEPLRQCVRDINADLKRRGIPFTLTMRAF